MSDYASSSTLGQFKTHEGDYSIEEEIFKIIGGTLKEKEQELRDTIDNQRKEIDRLNNIIDKAKEYIKEWQRFPHTNGSTHKELENLMKILDKPLKENNK